MNSNKNNIPILAKYLLEGKIVAIPTETVYGLAGNIYDKNAINKIFTLKGRPNTNPLICHIYSFEQISELTKDLTEKQKDYLNKLKHFWPGPLTIILPKSEKVPNSVTAGLDSVAIRIPNHKLTLELLKSCNVPLAAPSANISKRISPTSAKDVEEEFEDKLKYILDGGRCEIGLESTVLSLVEKVPSILRPGAITYEMIKEIIPEVIVNEEFLTSNKTQNSPGQQVKHYSPHTPLYFKDSCNLNTKNAGLISFSKVENSSDYFICKEISENEDKTLIASNLYSALRELDKLNLDYILIETCNSKGIGMAIMDRLKRAVKS